MTCFLPHDARFRRRDALFNVMPCFGRHDEPFDFMTCFERHDERHDDLINKQYSLREGNNINF